MTPPAELIISREPEFPGQVVWQQGSTLGIAPGEATARADAAALAQPPLLGLPPLHRLPPPGRAVVTATAITNPRSEVPF